MLHSYLRQHCVSWNEVTSMVKSVFSAAYNKPLKFTPGELKYNAKRHGK